MRVVHLIHSAKVGGVEAAAGLLRQRCTTLQLRLAAFTTTGGTDRTIPVDFAARGLNNPISLIQLVRYIRRQRPDILVTSLWRSTAVGFIASALLPRTGWVVYLHNTRYTNVVDRILHTVALRCADAVFCDSHATRSALVSPATRTPVYVVTPASAAVTELQPPQRDERDADTSNGNEIRLVFWGRLARQKRLDRAIELLAELQRTHPGGARLDIIGPDEGEAAGLTALADRLGIADRFHRHEPCRPEEIAGLAAEADFFVQLSDYEGLGMAVREAMHLGLVPVVTPVGEIPAYATDGVNAICSSADAQTLAQRVREVMTDPDRYRAAAQAVALPDFIGDFTSACREVSRA
ncbi:glycosyltransferase family 4 protein [Brevibacterium luteolum]|uniref:glycosyltransferase family 4 protein n=1 Tax=Brevibacterium luteolum TaxID=199591 RepID=UPI00223AE315|nr:glycosyltransferase family 4 protein [Brevibacterium luteolum]MCT1922362.1 glycosyltransferase family 4 protein [Brevibacterium luteolum]